MSFQNLSCLIFKALFSVLGVLTIFSSTYDLTVPTCSQTIEAGTCGGNMARFAFNTVTGQCEAFTYTGCGGNANMFTTLLGCQQTCESNYSDFFCFNTLHQFIDELKANRLQL